MNMNIKKIFGALICSLVALATYAQQPYGGCWHPDFIKDWSPEKDPDAKFNKSTVKLQPRITDDNIKANQYQFTDAQIATCLTMNPMCSMTPSQGANNFIGYNPTYWQYMDMVIWWGGSAGEGIIVPPSAPVIDACHMNGVKILGNIFFPPRAYSGDPAWVKQMLTKEGNTYPYAEKMYQIAKYYGFDGWFINEETSASTETEWAEWIKYFYQCAEVDGNYDMYIQWYDANPSVNNSLNIMKANPNTSFFANYGSASGLTIANNSDTLKNEGFSTEQIFNKLYSGIEQAQGGLTGNAQYFQACFPKTGHASSMQIFNPEEPIWKKTVEDLLDTENNCGQQAYDAMNTVFSNEARFWTNAQNNPADVTDRDNTYPNPWPGLANAIQERSVIQYKPFVTAFSAGLGKHRFVNGEKRGSQDWYHRGMQNILPTWRWWVEKPSSDQLNFELNWDDAYNFGTSIIVSGSMTANADHLTRLYKTNIAIENGDKFQLVYKTEHTGTIELKLADKTNPETFTTFKLNETSNNNGWSVAEIDLSSMAGKTLAVIALNFKTNTAIDDYKVVLGQLAVLPGSYSASAQVSNFQSQNSLQEDISDIRLIWDTPQSEEVDHYNVYLTRNGQRTLVGQTRNEGFYIPKFTRTSGEESVVASVVAVTKDMKEGNEVNLTLNYPKMTISDVSIIAAPTLVKVNEEVTLTAIANKNPESYEWILPAEATIISQEGNIAKVKFTQEGSYSITVKVKNPVGEATETNADLIEVNNTKEIGNVALGKEIEDVSGEIAASGEVASNLLDGKVTGCSIHEKWCVGGSKEHWVIIDLTQSYQLYKFRIVDAQVNESGADNLNNYKILLSNDLENWNEVVNTTGRKAENYHIDWIKPTAARYIKFIPYDNDAPITIRIWEFEAYGTEGSVSLSSIPDQSLETNSTLKVKAEYSLGDAAKEDNFAISFSVENENIVTVSELNTPDNGTYTFTLNGGAEVGKTNVTVTMINGEYQKSTSFAVTTYNASLVNLISNMLPTKNEEGTDTPANKGSLSNLTDGNTSTVYLPNYYAAENQSARFVYTFDTPKSINRFQSYFHDSENTEASLPTEVKFEISEDGNDFEIVHIAPSGTDAAYNLPEPKDAKAVAFTIGLGYWVTTEIAELEVYGKNATSVNEIHTENFHVSPNLVAKGQNITVSAEGAKTIEIYSLQGTKIKSMETSSEITYVTTDDLAVGTYLLFVKGTENKTVKIVVK